MKKILLNICALCAFCFIINTGFGQKNHNVVVLEGKGIVIDGDTLLLHRSTVEDVRNVMLNNEDYSISTNEYLVTRTYEETDPATGRTSRFERYSNTIKYRSFTFNFDEKNEPVGLTLKSIQYGNKIIE